MIEIPIEDCLWEKTSQTLIVPESKLLLKGQEQLCVIGKEYDIQFSWNEGGHWYRFAIILSNKGNTFPTQTYRDFLKSIVLIVDTSK